MKKKERSIEDLEVEISQQQKILSELVNLHIQRRAELEARKLTLPELLTVAQVAKYLQLTPAVIYTMIEQKKLKSVAVASNKIRIKKEDVEKYVADNYHFVYEDVFKLL